MSGAERDGDEDPLSRGDRGSERPDEVVQVLSQHPTGIRRCSGPRDRHQRAVRPPTPSCSRESGDPAESRGDGVCGRRHRVSAVQRPPAPVRGTVVDPSLDYDSGRAILLVEEPDVPLHKRQAAVTANGAFVAGVKRFSASRGHARASRTIRSSETEGNRGIRSVRSRVEQRPETSVRRYSSSAEGEGCLASEPARWRSSVRTLSATVCVGVQPKLV